MAQMLLVTVYGLQQRYGSGYVIDILRGSRSEKIQAAHRKLPTYGMGKSVAEHEWRSYIADLTTRGYLVQRGGAYPVLALTHKSVPVLKGDESVVLVRALPSAPAAASPAPLPVAAGRVQRSDILRLFRNGHTTENIALELGVQRSLVLEHLTYYVGRGDIEVGDLLPADKVRRITDALIDHSIVSGMSLLPVKQELGDEISYDEIRAVLASMYS